MYGNCALCVCGARYGKTRPVDWVSGGCHYKNDLKIRVSAVQLRLCPVTSFWSWSALSAVFLDDIEGNSLRNFTRLHSVARSYHRVCCIASAFRCSAFFCGAFGIGIHTLVGGTVEIRIEDHDIVLPGAAHPVSQPLRYQVFSKCFGVCRDRARLPWKQEVAASNPVAPNCLRDRPFGWVVERLSECGLEASTNPTVGFASAESRLPPLTEVRQVEGPLLLFGMGNRGYATTGRRADRRPGRFR